MPRVNFDQAEGGNPKVLIPSGQYPIKVLDVLKKESKKGEEYWNLKLEIQNGSYEGQIIWDNIFFTPKTLNRTKLIYKRLAGMELTGEQDLDSADLLGCQCVVETVVDKYIYEGEQREKSIVTFGGYLEKDTQTAEMFREDLKSRPKNKTLTHPDTFNPKELEDDIPDFSK